MRRAIGLIISFILVMGTAVWAAAAEETETETELALLAAIGVVSSANVSPQAELSRGDMALYLYRFIGAPEPPQDAKGQIFADVAADATQAPQLYYLKEFGILSGDENGNYYPDRPASFYQAVKAVTVAMGYEPLAAGAGGWPAGYIKAANDNRLLRGISVSTDGAVSQQTFFRLLYNALFAKRLEVSAISSAAEYSYREEMFLYDVHDVYEYTGTVEATEYTGLYSASAKAAKNHVTISGESFTTVQDAFAFIGLPVRCYVREEESGEDAVLLIRTRTDAEQVTVHAADILPSTDKNRLDYYDTETGKEDSMTISRAASVFYNNVFYTEINGLSASELRLADENGDALDAELTLVDTDDDGTADLVKIMQYDIVTVESVDAENGLVSDKYMSRYFKLDENEKSVICKIYRGGEQIAVSDLKVWDTLSIARSKDESVIFAYASVNLAKGVIETAADRILVDGKEYRYSHYLKTLLAEGKLETPKAGENASLLLDVFGNVACWQYSGEEQDKYGFLLGVDRGKGISAQAKLKLFTTADEFEILDVADRIKIGDESYKEAEWLEKGETISAQLVRYTVNEENEVNSLQTADTTYCNTIRGHNPDKFSLDFSGSAKWKTSGVLSGKYQLDGSAILFSIPNDLTNENAFMCSTPAGVLSNDQVENFELYDASETKQAAVAVIRVDSAGEKFSGAPALVKQITSGVNSSGEIIHKAYLFQNGKEMAAEAKDDNLMAGINAGDIIKFNTDSSGRIRSVQTVFSYKGEDSELYYSDAGNDNAGAGTANYACFVMAYHVSNANLEVTVNPDVKPEDPVGGTRLYLNGGNLDDNIYIFNAKNGTVRKGSRADIRPLASYGKENASKMFITGNYYQVSTVVLYE